MKRATRHPRRRQSVETGGITGNVDLDKERLVSAFGASPDLVIRELRTGAADKIRVLVAHIDGVVSREILGAQLVEQVINPARTWQSAQHAYRELRDRLVFGTEVKESESLDEIMTLISDGNCALLVEGVQKALAMCVRDWEKRALDEPSSEPSVRGPKEGFIESVRVNTSLLRKRLKSNRLWTEHAKIGDISRTDVVIAYIQGKADPDLVAEVRKRISQIPVGSIIESGQLEEFIRDAPSSLFPTVLRTERPDKVTAALMEGRVSVLVDGSPFALIMPATFTMFLAASEDYYEQPIVSSFIRLLRYAAFLSSLVLPALYVSVTTFHQELLPTPLILSIAAQRDGVPFPAVGEALLMEVVFEVLREAGIRLPRVVGSAVSIIGALVLGDAAIRAGLVSPAMVVVVAGTGIASFTTPVFSIAIGIRLLRFVMILLAASLGLYGVVLGLLGVLIHLSALRSFGVPYLAPLAPVVKEDLEDSLIRASVQQITHDPSQDSSTDGSGSP